MNSIALNAQDADRLFFFFEVRQIFKSTLWNRWYADMTTFAKME